MTALYRACLTPIGRSKQADFIGGGTPVQITHIAVDDGGGVPVDYTPVTTELTNEVGRYPVTRVYRSGDSKIAELVQLPSLEDYWVRGYGVIDEDGDLIAIVAVPEKRKPSTATGAYLTLVASIVLTAVNPDAFVMSVIVDSSAVMATQASLNAAIAGLPTAWPDAQKLGGELPSFYAKQSDLTSALPTGSEIGFWGSVAPAGYVLASGRTIGNAASGGTERANADTEALFTLLWNSTAQAELPIQTSAGGASTRGASAAVDFAANKRMPLPDLRGRVGVGKDDMGGTLAGRTTVTLTGTKASTANGIITGLSSTANLAVGMVAVGTGIAAGTTILSIDSATQVTLSANSASTGSISIRFGILDGSTMGAAGGSHVHKLTVAQMPSHAHVENHTGSGASGQIQSGGGGQGTTSSGISTGGAGGDQNHSNVQPSIVRNVIIKL